MDNVKKLFSVITQSFNQGKYINDCINSINIQRSSVNIEHIVVDAGSIDESRRIIDNYPKIIKIYERDNGPADGLNKGFNKSTGEICGFLNADDYYVEGGLEKIDKIFDDKSIDMVIAGGYIILKNGKKNTLNQK